MDFRLRTAILTGKIIAFLIKFKGGGATTAPGLYALKVDPNLVSKISKKNRLSSIVISGTNGKTTTSRLISDILTTKFRIIHNRQGSNLLRGVASTMISQASIFGKLSENQAIWEADEASMPEIVKNTSPKIIVLINLFRDQLDRYGEVDKIRKKWQETLENLPRETTLMLNADDPQVAYLAKSFKGKTVFFGVNQKKLDLPEISHVADVRYCLNCSAKLTYDTFLSAHMGHYHCSKCHFKRPNPVIFAQNLKFNTDFSTSLELNVNDQLSIVNCQLPGLYNIYNLLAASACATYFDIPLTIIKEKIENFSAAFGRFQSVSIDSKSTLIFLIKNPAGANEVLRTIALKNKINLLAILNDNIADGRDVSWIWDTNWEILAGKVNKVAISGIRCWDLANRFKYAGIELDKNYVHENIFYSINQTLKLMNNNNTLIILPTYTALLDVQKSLAKIGAITKWHEQ